MNNQLTSKSFNFNNVKGISSNQLNQHYKLYQGYVNKINSIWENINNIALEDGANPTYGNYRSALLGQSYALNGVKLHELYFENLNGKVKGIPDSIHKAIIDTFESYEKFEKNFINCGLSVRGWCVLGYDSIDNKLHVYGFDSHDIGVIVSFTPLLVLDVYEHAYMIDFGIDRKAYIDVFMKNIDWAIVNDRFCRVNNL